MNSFTRKTPTTIATNPNDSRTTNMHSQQHLWTMKNPLHYLGLGKNFNSMKNHPTWGLLSPAEFYETVREWDWNEIDGHTPTATMRANEWVPFPPDDWRTINTNALTTSSRTRSDDIAETINLIDETIAMCKPDIPGSQHDCGFRRIPCLGTTRTRSRLTTCHLRQLQELCNDQMR